jgi:hypothetical protein
LQKFNPASVVSSATRGFDLDDAERNYDSADCAEGGSDAEKESKFIEGIVAEGADAELEEQVEREGLDGTSELGGDSSLGDSSSFGVGSPRGGGVGTPSATPSRGGSVSRGRGGAVQQRQTIAQQQVAVLQQTKNQLQNVVACGTSGTSPRGSSTFDVTYAAVKREQIASTTLMHKETLDGLVELIVRLLCLMYSQVPNILNKKSCCLRKKFSAAIKNSKRS